MDNLVATNILEKWLKGWCLSRELPFPVQFGSGFKVNVNQKEQKARYVFSKPDDDFFRLADEICEPFVFLKVCTGPESIVNRMPTRWKLQPQGYLMYCFKPMSATNMSLPSGYRLEFEHYNTTFLIKILTIEGELASIGRVVLVDDLAIYDRILTTDKHRRKGLAKFLVKELEKIAMSKNMSKNILVATEEGSLLYQSLGWEIYSFYTSFVINN